MRTCFALLLMSCVALSAGAAELSLDLGFGGQRLDTQTLLARADARFVDIAEDVAYKRPMRYRAVPLRALLTDMTSTDHLQALALDGFAAEIEGSLVLEDNGAEAWLAVEDPAEPWPPLGEGKSSAGPFYVVWTYPEKARIDSEKWPYQIETMRKVDPVAVRFPAMRPDVSVAADASVRRGYTVFKTYCLPCHTLNGQGDAQMGPDLNLPYSPVEYFGADLLRTFIRNPQDLRRWPKSQMRGFDQSSISDPELDALLDYLRHMAGRKETSTAPESEHVVQ